MTKENIVHYQVVVSLRETIRLMKQVDAAIDVHGGVVYNVILKMCKSQTVDPP